MCNRMFSITFYGVRSFSPQHVCISAHIHTHTHTYTWMRDYFTFQVKEVHVQHLLCKWRSCCLSPLYRNTANLQQCRHNHQNGYFPVKLFPFTIISSFTTINYISHIFHNLVILVTLVFNIKHTPFPSGLEMQLQVYFFHFFFFNNCKNNIKMPVLLQFKDQRQREMETATATQTTLV